MRDRSLVFAAAQIDIKILDAMKRSTQCATIQLDFQMPQRFNLLVCGGAHVRVLLRHGSGKGG